MSTAQHTCLAKSSSARMRVPCNQPHSISHTSYSRHSICAVTGDAATAISSPPLLAERNSCTCMSSLKRHCSTWQLREVSYAARKHRSMRALQQQIHSSLGAHPMKHTMQSTWCRVSSSVPNMLSKHTCCAHPAFVDRKSFPNA